MSESIDRRHFLKKTTRASLGVALGGSVLPIEAEQLLPILEVYPFQLEKLDTVRIGMVGVGGMGTSHVRNFLRIKGCEIVAVSDIIPERVKRAQDMTVNAGYEKPEGYSKGEEDYIRMCERDDR